MRKNISDPITKEQKDYILLELRKLGYCKEDDVEIWMVDLLNTLDRCMGKKVY